MPSDLLVDCRRILSDEMDRIEAPSGWWSVAAGMLRVRWLEAATMASIGLAVGVYMSSGPTPGNTGDGTSGLPDSGIAAAGVSNLRIVEADPISGQIALVGEVVRPVRVQGRLEDEDIRQYVFSTLSSPTNPGERLRAVQVLAPNARDAGVQQALIGTLLQDDNPGVRLYALQALKPFAADIEVRAAFMSALENDENPGIRVSAIDALTPLTQDEATEEVVQEATRADPNGYVRTRALQYVGR
jgi:hypothetical protein